MNNEISGLHHVVSIETNKPGFTRDKPFTRLGTRLRLSSWLESGQGMFEQHLPEIESARIPEAH